MTSKTRLFVSIVGILTTTGPLFDRLALAEEIATPAPTISSTLYLAFPQPHFPLYLHTRLTLWVQDRPFPTDAIVDIGAPVDMVMPVAVGAKAGLLNRPAPPSLGDGPPAPRPGRLMDMHPAHLQLGDRREPLTIWLNDKFALIGLPILGMGFLSRHCVTFDFPHHRLLIAPPRPLGQLPAHDADALVIPYHPPDARSGFRGPTHIVLESEVNDVKGQFHVDTGFQYIWFGAKPAQVIGLIPPDAPLPISAEVTTASFAGVDVTPYLTRVFVREPTPAHQKSEALFGDLGLTFLRKFSVTIDAVNQRLILKPGKPPSSHDPPPALGLTVRPTGEPTGGLIITKIRPEGSGALAGLQKGDVLLAIDQTPLGSLEHLDRELEQYYEVGETITFTLRRGLTVQQLSMTLSAP